MTPERDPVFEPADRRPADRRPADRRPTDRRPTDRRPAVGRDGEDQAALWYSHHGYQIVERNWRSRTGEIDLVCARGDVLVFCEVKTRSSNRLGDPLEAVTRVKQLRLRRLAAEYLLLHTCGGRQLRFDVAAILGGTLTVVQGAF